MKDSKHIQAFLLVLLIFTLAILAGGCISPAKNIKERIQIIPPSDQHTKYYQKSFKRMLTKIKNPKLEEIAAKTSFDSWKRYEDEYLSFMYPDNPNIILEIQPQKTNKSSNNSTFIQAYRLKLGKHTYCQLTLKETDSFDDDFCFCGPIAYQKYLCEDNTFFRFELLENRYVKKIQALSDKYRVVVYEWTHLPITQEIYLTIGESIRFKQVSNEKELIEKTIKKYGGLGFLEKGMSKAKVIELLGEPTKNESNKLIYETTKNRYRDTITVNFDKNGQFEGFKKGWAQTISLPPKHGSIDWMLEKVKLNNNWIKLSEQEEDDFLDEEEKDYDLGLLTRKEAEFMISEFKRLNPTASEEDWNSLCVIAYELFENHGYKDASILPFLKARYLKGSPSHSASWILHEYEAEDREQLFAAQIKRIYDYGLKNIDKDELDMDFFELHNLFSFIGRDSQLVNKLIIEGSQHPNNQVRDEAFSFVDFFPDEKAIKFYRIGLKDKYKEIRERCAKAFSEEAGTAADIPELKKALSNEKEKKIQKLLDTALKRLSGIKGKNEKD